MVVVLVMMMVPLDDNNAGEKAAKQHACDIQTKKSNFVWEYFIYDLLYATRNTSELMLSRGM